jgi:hypothetical protein
MSCAASVLVCALSLVRCATQTIQPITPPESCLLPEVAPSEGHSRLPRVRSHSPVIVAVIREAAERSTTFRRLIATIDSTDGLVYVEEGKCGHSVRACLLMSVKVAGPYRLLGILVDTHRATGAELMASIGHELWHAFEVLSDPHVTDNRSIFWLFSRIGLIDTDSLRFETAEAKRTGLSVLEEVKAHVARSMNSTQSPPRVRSDALAIRKVIQQATERSATFKRLVDTIDQTDGIVYVVEGTCPHGVLACLMFSVTLAGQYRILRVKVDHRRTGHDLMASIGHELQHAIEVLRDVSLTSDLAIYQFYDRLAPTDKGRFETDAAIQAGVDVQAELGTWAKSR